MTKPRTSIHRELYGLIGSIPDVSNVQKVWNEYFRVEGIDATMNLYPTTEKNLPERLSEMFHFDRRAYIVGKDLSQAIIPLLDQVEPEARRTRTSCKAPVRGRGVAWVENENGVLIGKAKWGRDISAPTTLNEKRDPRSAVAP